MTSLALYVLITISFIVNVSLDSILESGRMKTAIRFALVAFVSAAFLIVFAQSCRCASNSAEGEGEGSAEGSTSGAGSDADAGE